MEATPAKLRVQAATERLAELGKSYPEVVAKTHVVVCLSGLSTHTNGSPIFGCIVYGPFTEDEVEGKANDIRRLEGGAVLVRPLVDLSDTYRRLSAD